MPSRFAELLRHHRLKRGLSQEALAEVARVGASSIGTYERGIHSAPHRDTVSALANALELQGATRTEFERAARRTPRSAVEKHAEARRDNLPSHITSFLGRESETSRTADLIRRHRIVTLTGSGGIGKTRLALHVASQLRNEHPDRLWFIDFSTIDDPSLILRRLAIVLEISLSGSSRIDDLLAHVAKRKQLLIFDNCEHLIKPIADLAATIARTTTSTTILATSRERLRISGEAVFRVPTLPVPTAMPETTADMQSFSAIMLFIDRATAVMPEFSFTTASIEAVVAICRRLEGIPLAIELAAARLPALGLSQLRDKLSDRFATLSIGPRDLAPRQQTLQATIAWSYELLDGIERTMIQALSTFPSSFTLVAGLAVCDPSTSEAVAIDVISSLADKSFLVIEPNHDADHRYFMLESTREYVRRARDASDCEVDTERFAQWCASFAETCDRSRFAMPYAAWCDMVRSEFESVSAALGWALADPNRAILAGRIVAHLRAYWVSIGRSDELAQLAERLLTLISATEHPSLTARLLFCLYHKLSARENTRNLLVARTILEGVQDHHGLIACNLYLGACLGPEAPVDSLRAVDEVERLAKLLDLPRARLYSSETRVAVLRHAGRLIDARQSLLEQIRHREAFGEMALVAEAKVLLADVEFSLGDAERATEITKEVVTLGRLTGASLGYAVSCLSQYLAVLGENDEARHAARTILSDSSLQTHSFVIGAILSLAVVGARCGKTANAARLFGFYDANNSDPEFEGGPGQACRKIILDLVGAASSEESLDAQIIAGRDLSHAAAIEEALAV